jgi:16S rRNA (cytosine1402-N4)-methyltransferase
MAMNAHLTVMLEEAVQALLPAGEVSACADSCYVDATFGRGGHSQLLLSRLPETASVIAFDKDPEAVEVAQAIADPRLSIRHEGFKAIATLPPGSVDGILMDLGVSSPQIDQAGRGFSFRTDGPLDMRMNPTRGPTVAQWLATARQEEISEVIRDFGEERFAGSIAKAIVARREAGRPVERTLDLSQLVAEVVRTREAGQNPATRTFQALRIFINAELEELREALGKSIDVLRPGGRLVVISFHSLEDRIVKQFMGRHARSAPDRNAPFAPLPKPELELGGRFFPEEAEVQRNPRARSAVMRVARKVLR